MQCTSVACADVRYVLPPDAQVLNVKDAPFFAKGDGVTDDTEAIQRAVRAALGANRYSAPPFVYLPRGVYRVTDTIQGKASEYGWADGWRAGMIIWGEGRAHTIVKLDNHHANFQDANSPKPIFVTGSESDERTQDGDNHLSGFGNRAFRHGFYHLTIDIGAGNAGAVGIDYIANNRGAVKDVLIRSSDPSRIGHTGLKLTRFWPGPALYKDITVEGFDYGIDVATVQYGNVFEHITLNNQRTCAFRNERNMVVIRDLISSNSVPAICGTHEHGAMTLLDAKLVGGESSATAITSQGSLCLQNVTVGGYGKSVEMINRPTAHQLPNLSDDSHIPFYASEVWQLGVHNLEPFSLPFQETPEYWNEDFDQWACPQDFRASGLSSTADWTDAIQLALDAGCPVVYLPCQSYIISKTLKVPSHVRLIHGFQSAISIENSDDSDVPIFEFSGDSPHPVIVTHFRLNGPAHHASSRAVAFCHVDVPDYTSQSSSAGTLFLEDTIGPKPLRIVENQNVFARQLNIEFGSQPLVENHGGNLWALGFKTEGEMVCLHQTRGVSEILGAFVYPLKTVTNGVPAFLIEGGEVRLTYTMNGVRYPNQVESKTRVGNHILTGGVVSWRSAAYVSVVAGSTITPTPNIYVKRDDALIVDNCFSIPFWKASDAGDDSRYHDERGNLWGAYSVGASSQLNKRNKWVSLLWNDTKARWDGASLTDMAPTYIQKNVVLRSRTTGNKVAALTFEAAKSGFYRIEGAAYISEFSIYFY